MTTYTHENALKEVEELDLQQGRELFDEVARSELDMSGSEFLAAWDRGDFAGVPERPEVMSVAMLIPFAR